MRRFAFWIGDVIEEDDEPVLWYSIEICSGFPFDFPFCSAFSRSLRGPCILLIAGLSAGGVRDGVGGLESSHEVYAPGRAELLVVHTRKTGRTYRLHDQSGVV